MLSFIEEQSSGEPAPIQRVDVWIFKRGHQSRAAISLQIRGGATMNHGLRIVSNLLYSTSTFSLMRSFQSPGPPA